MSRQQWKWDELRRAKFKADVAKAEQEAERLYWQRQEEWLNAHGWHYGQFVDYDYDLEGNQYVDGYFSGFEYRCEITGQSYIASDKDQAIRIWQHQIRPAQLQALS